MVILKRQLLSVIPQTDRLRQLMNVRALLGRLVGRRSWRQIGCRKVEELRHIRLECIPVVQTWQVEPPLNEFQHGREIHRRVGDKMRLGEGRNHHYWNAKARNREISWWISRRDVLRRDSIR